LAAGIEGGLLEMKSEKEIRSKIKEIEEINKSNQMLWLDTYIGALKWVLNEEDDDNGGGGSG
jgi:hypothetical protein